VHIRGGFLTTLPSDCLVLKENIASLAEIGIYWISYEVDIFWSKWKNLIFTDTVLGRMQRKISIRQS
jgi:hypothetical protein